MKHKLLEMYGWYGAVAILTSFFLISFNYVDSHSLIYQILNFTGALGIALNAIVKKDYPASALNIIYSIIALVVLAQIIF